MNNDELIKNLSINPNNTGDTDDTYLPKNENASDMNKKVEIAPTSSITIDNITNITNTLEPLLPTIKKIYPTHPLTI